MLIHIKIAHCLDSQIYTRMVHNLVKHVVEEFQTRIYAICTLGVKVDTHFN